MAEWLVERGIGETRAALVEDGRIVEARVRRDDDRPALGAVLRAQILSRAANGRILVETPSRHWKIVLPSAPPGLSVGSDVLVEVTREMIPERGGRRPALGRLADPDAREGGGAPLVREAEQVGAPLIEVPVHGPDRLEEAGWSELVEEAHSGEIGFPGGRLLLYVTPAMTLFDVDGTLPPRDLAIAAAPAIAAAIRRHGIGGSIGIDFPTLAAKADRQAVAAAFDLDLPLPFERTAVNGFGFLQVVRRRARASLPELVQGDPYRSGAIELMRRAVRVRGAGKRTLSCNRPTASHLAGPWLDALTAWTGVRHEIRDDPLAPWYGHVHVEHP